MIEQTTLSNNLRVITNKLPSFKTTAVGAFVNVGSRNETIDNNGIAHFQEHMIFKGSNNRTAYEISQQVEVLGSHINAYTSTEMTAYYANGLTENVEIAVDIIGDALTNSIHAEEDIKLESGVILQEISRYEDNPSSTMHSLFMDTAYPNQPVGRKILGTKEFVSNAKKEDFKKFVNENYSAETMIVFAAGGAEHSTIVNAVDKAFNMIPKTTIRPALVPATYVGGLGIDASKSFEQVSVGIGFKTVPINDPDMYIYMILANAFGGGMSSPLFTEVREKRGLVYSTSAYSDVEIDYGHFAIFGGMTPNNLKEFIDVSCSELAKMSNTINELDMIRAKNSVYVSLAKMEEDTEHMLSYMANSVFNKGRVRGFEEIRSDIEKISMDDLKDAAAKLIHSKPTISLVGPVPDADYEYFVKRALSA